MNAQNLVLAVVVSVALSACSSPQPTHPAQPTTINAQGAYRHLASGTTFPPAVGDFRRVNITQYDVAGEDVGVEYNLASPTASIAATVYVYPAPSLTSIGSPPDVVASARATLCNNEFARRKKELVDAHSARLIQETAALPPGGGVQLPGAMAAFEYDDLFGGRRQALHSELYVFCYVGGKWTFKYRFTSPKNLDASGAISTFMASLPWNVPPQ